MSLQELPRIYGLKLGMTMEESEKLFPAKSGIRLGKSINHLKSSEISKVKGFELLESVIIVFARENFDSDIHRIYSLTFRYKQDSINWVDNEGFAKFLSKNFGTDFDMWTISPLEQLKNELKPSMNCRGFRIIISTEGNSFSLRSDVIENQLKNIEH